MAGEFDEIRGRLEAIAEELADLAIIRLRESIDNGGHELPPVYEVIVDEERDRLESVLGREEVLAQKPRPFIVRERSTRDASLGLLARACRHLRCPRNFVPI